MSPNRKLIETFGRKKRPDYVRIVREPVEGVSKIRVFWKEHGRRTETFEDTRNGLREARAFAEAKHEALRAPAAAAPIARISLRQLHERYVSAKVTEWADNTTRLCNERWADFELFAGRETFADTINRTHLDELKKVLLAAGRSPNQVKAVLKEVVRHFAWGVEWDVLTPTKLTLYTVKFTKAVRRSAPQMAEYSLDERERILGAMDPRNPRQWRAWVLTTLLAYAGPRQTAARHLEVDDIELSVEWDTVPAQPAVMSAGREQAVREGVDADTPGFRSPRFVGRVHWRAETNKTDQDWWQPLPGSVAEALYVALGWRQWDGYTGRFVFYGVQRRTRGQALRRHTRRARSKSELAGITVDEKPWTYSAYNAQLHAAERRAGVETIKYRAAHGHRRGVAGDVHAATGSLRSAADFLGDRSTKVVSDHYVLQRQDELKKTAGTMEAKRNEVLRERKEGSETPSEPSKDSINSEPAVGIEPTTARSHGEP